jgi:hypothetical protein
MTAVPPIHLMKSRRGIGAGLYYRIAIRRERSVGVYGQINGFGILES